MARRPHSSAPSRMAARSDWLCEKLLRASCGHTIASQAVLQTSALTSSSKMRVAGMRCTQQQYTARSRSPVASGRDWLGCQTVQLPVLESPAFPWHQRPAIAFRWFYGLASRNPAGVQLIFGLATPDVANSVSPLVLSDLVHISGISAPSC